MRVNKLNESKKGLYFSAYLEGSTRIECVRDETRLKILIQICSTLKNAAGARPSAIQSKTRCLFEELTHTKTGKCGQMVNRTHHYGIRPAPPNFRSSGCPTVDVGLHCRSGQACGACWAGKSSASQTGNLIKTDACKVFCKGGTHLGKILDVIWVE